MKPKRHLLVMQQLPLGGRGERWQGHVWFYSRDGYHTLALHLGTSSPPGEKNLLVSKIVVVAPSRESAINKVNLALRN